jgi:glucokinase
VDSNRVIGVDVGGTKILAGIVDGDGTLEQRRERETPVDSQDALLDALAASVEEFAGDGAVAVGFGIPSRIDQRHGRVDASVNIPLHGIDFRDRMTDRLGLPVAIENDANAATLAESRAGAGRGAATMVMLTLGTGCGGGVVLDGSLYRGWAEFGHMVVVADGAPCPCGGRGHLESFAAGPAADRAARDLYGPGADAHELVSRARAGEGDAVGALAAIGRYLGAGIAGFVNTFEPEVVVVGGGFGAAGELLLGPARDVVATQGLHPARDTVRIVQAELGSDAGVIGAGMIGFEALDAEA